MSGWLGGWGACAAAPPALSRSRAAAAAPAQHASRVARSLVLWCFMMVHDSARHADGPSPPRHKWVSGAAQVSGLVPVRSTVSAAGDSDLLPSVPRDHAPRTSSRLYVFRHIA